MGLQPKGKRRSIRRRRPGRPKSTGIYRGHAGSTSNEVRKHLLKSVVVFVGDFQAIANRFGVTRELVRQIAIEPGIGRRLVVFDVSRDMAKRIEGVLQYDLSAVFGEIGKGIILRTGDKKRIANILNVSERTIEHSINLIRGKGIPVEIRRRGIVTRLDTRDSQIRRALMLVFKTTKGRFPKGINKLIARELGVVPVAVTKVKTVMAKEGIFEDLV